MDDNQNAALWFVDRHVAEGRGDHIAFREIDGAKRALSYAGLADQSSQIAGALLRAGINREERAACILLDKNEYPAIFFGAMKAGVIPVALNTLLGTPLYHAILDDCRASCLFVSAELLDVIKPAIKGNPYLRQVVVIGDAPEGMTGFDEFIEGTTPQEAVKASGDETAFWLYSSGSTGRPKGVLHVHSAMRATAESYGSNVLGIRPDDVVFSAAKIFFAYGLGNSVSFPMSVGATSLLFSGRPTPDSTLEAIGEHAPSIFCGVPTLYAAMLASLEGKKPPSHALRLAISAGEALPAEIGHRWRELMGVDILDGVGSTEMLHIFLSNQPGDIVYGSSGRAVPGYALRCVGEDGAEIKPGEIGELLVDGASSASGYWNQREKSRATFEGRWTRTGDKYEIRDDRYYYAGRSDDMFKVSGIWVSPFEVEQALIAHPSVLEAAVVPKRDAEGLEKPKAFIVLKEGQKAEGLEGELKELVKDRIGKWKYPRFIEFVDDLPKTATGKIQRFMLREDGG